MTATWIKMVAIEMDPGFKIDVEKEFIGPDSALDVVYIKKKNQGLNPSVFCWNYFFHQHFHHPNLPSHLPYLLSPR